MVLNTYQEAILKNHGFLSVYDTTIFEWKWSIIYKN